MQIAQLYASRRPLLSFEVFPPKKEAEMENIGDILAALAKLSPDYISVTYGAGGSPQTVTRTREIAVAIQSHGIPALSHLTCVGADRDKIRSVVGALHESGVENILALRGDIPANHQGPVSRDYRYASELVAEIKELNGFCVGAACYPEGHIECDVLSHNFDHMKAKEAAGADFFITQLFFDNDYFYRFVELARREGIESPISAGVMPILSRSQVERMIFMCGVSLPSAIIKLLHRYGDNPSDLRKAGIEHAAAQGESLLRHGVDGVHLYTMNQPDIAEQVVPRLREAL